MLLTHIQRANLQLISRVCPKMSPNPGRILSLWLCPCLWPCLWQPQLNGEVEVNRWAAYMAFDCGCCHCKCKLAKMNAPCSRFGFGLYRRCFFVFVHTLINLGHVASVGTFDAAFNYILSCSWKLISSTSGLMVSFQADTRIETIIVFKGELTYHFSYCYKCSSS